MDMYTELINGNPRLAGILIYTYLQNQIAIQLAKHQIIPHPYNNQTVTHHVVIVSSPLINSIYIYILVFDPCYARATVVRARFLAAAFSDGSYLAHVNGAYLRHVKFCIVRGPPLFIVSPISQRGPLPRLVQSPRRRTPASPILV